MRPFAGQITYSQTTLSLAIVELLAKEHLALVSV
jgi:hypothetical protein